MTVCITTEVITDALVFVRNMLGMQFFYTIYKKNVVNSCYLENLMTPM